MLTLQAAKNLTSRDTLFCTESFNKKGEPHQVKITSVQTWKTRPNEVLVKWKFGLYEYGSFNETQLYRWTLDRDEARQVWIKREIEALRVQMRTFGADPKRVKLLERLTADLDALRQPQE